MSVRFGAGGALRRDSNCEMYDSVTWAARARSRCPNPSSCNRCRTINGTSTGLLLSRTACLNSRWSSHANHNISDLTKVVKPGRFHSAGTQPCAVPLWEEAARHGYGDEDKTEGLPARGSGGDPPDGRHRADEGWALHPGHGQGKADPG